AVRAPDAAHQPSSAAAHPSRAGPYLRPGRTGRGSPGRVLPEPGPGRPVAAGSFLPGRAGSEAARQRTGSACRDRGCPDNRTRGAGVVPDPPRRHGRLAHLVSGPGRAAVFLARATGHHPRAVGGAVRGRAGLRRPRPPCDRGAAAPPRPGAGSGRWHRLISWVAVAPLLPAYAGMAPRANIGPLLVGRGPFLSASTTPAFKPEGRTFEDTARTGSGRCRAGPG